MEVYFSMVTVAVFSRMSSGLGTTERNTSGEREGEGEGEGEEEGETEMRVGIDATAAGTVDPLDVTSSVVFTVVVVSSGILLFVVEIGCERGATALYSSVETACCCCREGVS